MAASARATIAVWLVMPPVSVANAMIFSGSNAAACDGVMSVAMVFHQFESDPDIEVPAQAGHEVTPELNGGSK